MKNILVKALSFLFLMACGRSFGQLQVTQGGYTACPNQIVTVTAVWNNVSITSLSLQIPPNGSGQGNLQTNTTFTVSHNGNGGSQTFTLIGAGTGNSGAVTSTVQFNLTIQAPPPLNIINTTNYCPGTSATITVPAGGDYYIVNGPCQNNVQYNSNVIIWGPLQPGCGGTFQVTSVGGCTMQGVTTVAIAPNNQITVNSNSNVCQGGSVNLQSSLTNGSNFTWYNPGTQAISNNANHLLTGVTVNDGGTYTVTADISFNGITCQRIGTTQVSVVQTNPVIVAASPSSVLCQGDKLTLSAGASGAVGYVWTGPAGFNSTLPNPNIFPLTPSNGGIYTVVANFANSFITCQTTASINIAVVAVTQPIIFMPQNICQNANFTFSASAGSNVFSWSWFGPGFSANTQASVINNIQPNQSGTYYVTAVYALNSTTCASTSSTQLNVVQVNSVAVLPPNPVCIPDNAYLQANATGAIAYNWVGPNSYSAFGSNVTVYYPQPNASGIYTVTASFGGGNLICKNSNTVALTVNPVMNFSLIPRQQACYNASMAVSGPPGATSYTWTSSTGFTSNSKDIFFPSVQPKNAGSYTLTINLGPCITNGSTSIEVLNPIGFTLTPQDRVVCSGDTVVMEAGVTGGSENYAYMWTPPIFLDTPVGSFKRITPTGSVIYNIAVHDIACPNYTVAHTFSVTVNQPPKPDLQLPVGEGCAPFCLTYDAKIPKAESWNTIFDFGSNLQFQRDTAFTYCLTQAGTYTLDILTKGTNGCSGKFTYPYPIIVHPRPGTDIYWSPESPTTADEITFYSTHKYDPIIYQNWSFNGGVPTVIDTAAGTGPGSDTTHLKNPSRRYEAYGKYPVMLISQNDQGCYDTIVKFIDVIDELNVFIPNSFTPNDDGLNDEYFVKGVGIKTEGFLMELSDRSGTPFFTTKDINERWDGKVNGTTAMNGVYIYKVRVVGMNGEGRKEYVGYFSLIR